MSKKLEEACSYLQKFSYKATNVKKGKDVPTEGGIYAIKNGRKVVYIGMSSNNIRRRLLAHLGGYGNKGLAKYLKRKRSWKNMYVSWKVTKYGKCGERSIVNCMTKFQGQRPKYNRTWGNSCEEE